MEVLENLHLLEIKDEALLLAQKIVRQNLIPQKAAEDAAHIAIATTNGMDYLLTWNMKHIANAVIRGKIEAFCRREGYLPPVICTPEELMEDV